MPEATVPVSAPELVGRRADLATIRAAIDLALHSQTQTVRVVGPAGVGKTRFARHLIYEAGQRGFVTAWGSAWESGLTPGFWPWTQILRRLVETLGAAPHEFSSELANLLSPDLALTEHEESNRLAVFDAVQRFLEQSTRSKPIFIVLDDAHLADAASLLLLSYLSRSLHDARLIMLVLGRPSDAAEHSPTIGHELRMTLESLSPQECGELFESITGRTISADLKAQVYAATGGNPLLTTEMALAVRSSPSVDLEGGGEIGQAVRRTLLLRLKDLPSDTLEAIRNASVVGRAVDLRVLASMLRLELDAVPDLLEPAVSSSVCALEEGFLVFGHELIREAIYRELRGPDRARAHLLAAEAIESRMISEDQTAEVAFHLLQATSSTARGRAIEMSRRAGDVALQRAAYESAESHYQDAIDLADRDHPQLVEMLLALARARLLAGHRETGVQVCKEAVRWAHERGLVELAAEGLTTLGTLRSGSRAHFDPEMRGWLDDVLARLPRGSLRPRVALLGAKALEGWLTPDPQVRADLDAAISEARESGAEEALLDGLRAYAAILGPDDHALHENISAEMVRVAELRGLNRTAAFGHARLAMHCIDRADPTGLASEVASINELAQKIKQPLVMWLASIVGIAQAIIRWEVDTARTLIDHSQTILPVADHPDATAVLILSNVAIMEHEGGLEQMEPVVLMGRDLFPSMIGPRAGLAWMAAECGRRNEALSRLEPLMGEVASIPRTTQWLFSVSFVARAVALVEDVEMSRVLYNMLLPYSDRHVYLNVGGPGSYNGCVATILGMMARTLGRYQEAIGHLEDASIRLGRLGAAAWATRNNFEFARTLLGGDAEDRRRGAEMLEQVQLQAEQMGLRTTVDAIAALPRVPVGPADESPSDEIRLFQEGDFWTVQRGQNVTRIRDMRGLAYLFTLLREPEREFHALDLLMSTRLVPPPQNGDLSDRGGTQVEARGPGISDSILDPRAKAAYKKRIDELREQIDDSEGRDNARAARAREELEFLMDQLSSALGMGGRSRNWSDPGERARISVTKSIKRAIAKIKESDEPLGRFLEAHITTGIYCTFRRPSDNLRVVLPE